MVGAMISEGSGDWRRVGSRSWRMRRAIMLAQMERDIRRGESEKNGLFPSLTFRSSGGLPPGCVSGRPRPSDRGGNVAVNQTSGRLRECASGSVVSGCEEEGGVVVVVDVEGEGGLLASSKVRRGNCKTAVAAAVLDRCRRMIDEGRNTTEVVVEDVGIVRLCRVVRW